MIKLIVGIWVVALIAKGFTPFPESLNEIVYGLPIFIVLFMLEKYYRKYKTTKAELDRLKEQSDSYHKD